MRRVHRADAAARSATRRARKRATRQRRAWRDDAGRHRGHARPRDGRRLRRDGVAIARRRGAARPGHARARHVPAGHRPRARAPRPRRDRRRRRAHGARRVREPALRRGVHRAGVWRGHGRRVAASRRSGSSEEPGHAHGGGGPASSRPTAGSDPTFIELLHAHGEPGRTWPSSASGRTTGRG